MNTNTQRTVFHIIPTLEIGGTEKQLLLILPHLQTRFNNEVVCLMGTGPISRALKDAGIRVHHLHGQHNFDVRIPLRLYNLFRRHQPDAIVTYLIVADIFGRFAGRGAGIKAVIESHRSNLFGPPWRHQLDRFTRWLVDHYVAQTDAAKELLQKTLRIAPHQITVIGNAVEYTAASQDRTITRRQQGIGQHDFVITAVANLKPEKHLDTIIRAVAQLHSRFPNLHVWFVGDGPERSTLKRLAHLLPDHIHFFGLRNDVPDLLAASDMFVLPTVIEGMSNALLEAMAAGLPCITTDIPANHGIIAHGATGLLVPPRNITALANAIAELIEQPQKRARLGQVARAYVDQHHSTVRITSGWHQLIESYINT